MNSPRPIFCLRGLPGKVAPTCVYLRTLDREYSRSRKYFQLTNERLVQAELALRYWQDHDNLHIWAPIPLYTDRTDYRSLEMALIPSGNPNSTTPSFVNSSIQRRVSSKKPFSTPMHDLAWPLFGVAPSTNLLHNLFAKSLPHHGFKTV